jgi:hypothetical protein
MVCYWEGRRRVEKERVGTICGKLINCVTDFFTGVVIKRNNINPRPVNHCDLITPAQNNFRSLNKIKYKLGAEGFGKKNCIPP